MRRAIAPIQPAAPLHVDLAERLRVTAARLGAIPAGAATSLSITTGWQGHTEADVRAVAAAIAEPLGLRPEVHGHGGHAESVTVTFHRAGLRHR